MAKIIEAPSPGPDDPIFREGPTSYNPHPKPDGQTDDKPDPGAWLQMAHFGVVGNPLLAMVDDPDPDPDDEELAVTPPEVVMILGFDSLDDE